MTSTRITRHVNAPREIVYHALTDADGGTDIVAVHGRLPPGLSPADNETGWRMSLDKLAALVEADRK
jgi:uncharacterized protein YndB with AHSA1/START domain